MRIGINTLFLVPGDVGGTEIYLRQNLMAMAKQARNDTFVLFTNRENDALLRGDLTECNNIQYQLINICAANRPIRILAEQTLLPLQARKAKLDVLWSPGYTGPLISPCPQVVTIHDLQYLSFPQDMKRLDRWTLDFLVRQVCQRCTHIITVSEFSKSEILRHGFARSSQITVIYEGVDPAFGKKPPPPPSPPLRTLFQLGNAPYILCVAHTYPHKNVHLLIEAFDLLADSIPHHVVLIGKPRLGENEVEASLERSPHTARIHRISGLTYPELIVAFQQADLFVLPSVYEGFGLPVLEAMLAGIPVITTREAALGEVGGAHAHYVQAVTANGFAEAIRSVIGLTQEKRAVHIDTANIWAATFSWDKSATSTLQLFGQVAETHRS
jgi:glycosyltransferase involved in cell wall biosynthesis